MTSTGCPCGTCVPSPMLGRSWWKCLGFNSPVGNCAEALYDAGFATTSGTPRGERMSLTGNLDEYLWQAVGKEDLFDYEDEYSDEQWQRFVDEYSRAFAEQASMIAIDMWLDFTRREVSA